MWITCTVNDQGHTSCTIGQVIFMVSIWDWSTYLRVHRLVATNIFFWGLIYKDDVAISIQAYVYIFYFWTQSLTYRVRLGTIPDTAWVMMRIKMVVIYMYLSLYVGKLCKWMFQLHMHFLCLYIEFCIHAFFFFIFIFIFIFYF